MLQCCPFSLTRVDSAPRLGLSSVAIRTATGVPGAPRRHCSLPERRPSASLRNITYVRHGRLNPDIRPHLFHIHPVHDHTQGPSVVKSEDRSWKPSDIDLGLYPLFFGLHLCYQLLFILISSRQHPRQLTFTILVRSRDTFGHDTYLNH